ncbi:hypothetical protein HUJ04_006823 [Dendroctonus ponderosae]|nr:hypothetical protein HUJ04_006823 [Dendroctonus ponderosae]
MPSTTQMKSPTEDQLILDAQSPQSTENEKIKMKKHMGLLEGVAIILGIIFGSGIFISPKGVIEEVDSVGCALVLWILCGLLSMIGALCYAELGTCIPKSGGDYTYINEAYGSLPSFLYLWAANVIFVPTTNSIMGLTFAKYVIQPFFPNCDMPDLGVRLVAAAVICFLTFLNSYNVKVTMKLQNVFMFCKLGALILIVSIGIVWMCLGNIENFSNAFAHTTTNPGKIATAFYSGIFSYSGWNYLNFMTEELQDPFVNLPRAIYISLPLVTTIYVLANMAYMSVLTPAAIVSTDAIAVTFGNAVLGKYSWILALLVAVSAFGGLSVHIMSSSRMLYAGARNDQFPVMLAHLNVKTLTPVPSLLFLDEDLDEDEQPNEVQPFDLKSEFSDSEPENSKDLSHISPKKLPPQPLDPKTLLNSRKPEALPRRKSASSSNRRLGINRGKTSNASDSEDSGNEEQEKKIPGEYDPAQFANLQVQSEVAELFEYIVRYSPAKVATEYKFKPFIPEFLPAVGDIDAFLKVIPPDTTPSGEVFDENVLQLGLVVLDEPASNQSDPALLHLQLRAENDSLMTSSEQKHIVVKKISNVEKNSKVIEKWIKDVSHLHKSKCSPVVRYSQPMPDIDDLMQQWPEDLEGKFKEAGFPRPNEDQPLSSYVDTVCNYFQIPKAKNKIQSLHLLFCLYTAMKQTQLYQAQYTVGLEKAEEIEDRNVTDHTDQLVLD